MRFPDGVFWASRWKDAAAAERFAGVFPGAEARGDVAVVRAGEVPDGERLLARLLGRD